MLAKITRVFTPPSRRPVLRPDEGIVMEGRVAFLRSMVGARTGRLILTNYRLVWYEDAWIWPLKPYAGEYRLDVIRSADKGTLFDFFAGGRRLRIRLKSGRSKCFFENEGKLDEWIAAIRHMVS